MPIKKYKPTTPGSRYLMLNAYAEITSDNKPQRGLIAKQKSSGGRNNQGRMTTRYLGGGHKKRYRIIDTKRDKVGVPGVVKTIEYDPNRTAFIALISYKDGDKRYILAPEGLQVGQTVVSDEKAAIEIGNTLPLKNIPLGTVIHNREMSPGRGGAISRSADTFAQVTAKEGKSVTLKMHSGEPRLILATCRATVGSVSNPEHRLVVLGKGGRKRWLGRRPRTRGVAMKPVDHPMGGGEGKASGGHPRSRKGLYAKGLKTRHPKNKSDRLIVNRKKK
jgi:large subunit ribosomal protein L2